MLKSLQELDKNLLQGGTYLFTAPTGVGKTHNIINLCKNILSKYNNYLIILTTPTKLQAKQIGNTHKIHTVTSGINVIKTNNVNSVVYDKIDLILNNLSNFKNYKIILIVDEAHELINSIQYRATAIGQIKKLSKIAHTTLHITATPMSNKLIYNYNNIIEIEQTKAIENINILEGLNLEKEAISKAIKNLNEGKTTILQYNNHKKLNKIYRALKKLFPNKNIILFTAENKDNEEFENLVQNNKLNDNVNLVLCTNVLNAGINIFNKNIELVYICNRFNLDQLIQFAGRTRDIKTVLTIIKPKSQVKPLIKNKYEKLLQDTYKTKLVECEEAKEKNNNIIRELKRINSNREPATEETQNLLSKHIKAFCKSLVNQDPNKSANFLKYDEIRETFEIDKEALILSIINELGELFSHTNKSQFKELMRENLLSNINEINNNEENISQEIYKEIQEQEKQEKAKAKELEKEFKREVKTLREEEKRQLAELFNIKFKGEKEKIISVILESETIPIRINQIYKKINEVSYGKKIINKLEKIFKNYSDIEEGCLYTYFLSNFNEDSLKEQKYISFNKIIPNIYDLNQDLNSLELKEYITIRKEFDLTKDERLNKKSMQRKITKKNILNIYNNLHKEKKTTLTNRIVNQIVKEINLIYNLKNNNLTISSLKKIIK